MAFDPTGKSGYLIKQGRLRSNWKKRWFVLDTTRLAYYDSPEKTSGRPLGCISLKGVVRASVRRADEEIGKQFAFALRVSERTYYCVADSEEEVEDWLQVVAIVLNENNPHLHSPESENIDVFSESEGEPVEDDDESREARRKAERAALEAATAKAEAIAKAEAEAKAKQKAEAEAKQKAKADAAPAPDASSSSSSAPADAAPAPDSPASSDASADAAAPATEKKRGNLRAFALARKNSNRYKPRFTGQDMARLAEKRAAKKDGEDELPSAELLSQGYQHVKVSRDRWKRRYFTLDSDGLLCFFDTQDTSDRPLGYFDLSEVKTVEIVNTELGREHCYRVDTVKASYWLQAETDEDMRDWIGAMVTLKKEIKTVETTVASRYAAVLEEAKTADLLDIGRLNIVSAQGKDVSGRPVVLIAATNIPNGMDMDRLLLYLIRVMDPIVSSGPYTLVYCHGSPMGRVKLSWFKRAYRNLSRDYKKNLKVMYVLNPTTWLTLAYKSMSPFLSKAAKKKVVYIHHHFDLYQHVKADQVTLPSALLQNESKKKSTRVFGVALDEVLDQLPEPKTPAALKRGSTMMASVSDAASPFQTYGWKADSDIPDVVHQCLVYLRKHAANCQGIFSMDAGKDEDQVERYRQIVDAGEKLDLSSQKNPHVVASLLLTYLRELPEPLLTYDLYEHFIDAMSVRSAKISTGWREWRLYTIQSLVHEYLPPANRALFQVLVTYLIELAEVGHLNEMPADKLAAVFGPLLLRSKKPAAETDGALIVELFTLFFKDSDYICSPPALAPVKPTHKGTIRYQPQVKDIDEDEIKEKKNVSFGAIATVATVPADDLGSPMAGPLPSPSMGAPPPISDEPAAKVSSGTWGLSKLAAELGSLQPVDTEKDKAPVDTTESQTLAEKLNLFAVGAEDEKK